MRGSCRPRRRRRRLIGVLAVGLALSQAVGCSSCVDDVKKEPPAPSGPELAPRAKVTDKRPHFVPGTESATADAAPDAPR
jgi:hypothetical protein